MGLRWVRLLFHSENQIWYMTVYFYYNHVRTTRNFVKWIIVILWKKLSLPLCISLQSIAFYKTYQFWLWGISKSWFLKEAWTQRIATRTDVHVYNIIIWSYNVPVTQHLTAKQIGWLTYTFNFSFFSRLVLVRII